MAEGSSCAPSSFRLSRRVDNGASTQRAQHPGRAQAQASSKRGPLSADDWASLVNELMEFMLSFDPWARRADALTWLEEPLSGPNLPEKAAAREQSELARVRSKVEGGEELSRVERELILSALPSPGQPGRPRKHRLSLEDRNRKLALCAVAVRETYGLRLYRRDGSGPPGAPRHSACDAVVDALKGHFIDGRTSVTLGYSSVKTATRKWRINAEREWENLVRNAEELEARNRAIRRILDAADDV